MPKNHETFAFYTRESDRMRNGMWPMATTPENFYRLDWYLMRKKSERSAPEHICEISFADFGGEIYRIAFGNGNHGDRAAELDQSIRQVKEHVFNSDALIVLVNLADVINGSHSDSRTIELLWLTQDMFRQANKNGKWRNIALVFTQADAYSETITACGGLRGVLSKYLPQVYAGYSNRISLFAVSAVSKTIPASDGSGFTVPTSDFNPLGMEDVIDWICKSVKSRKSWKCWLSVLIVAGVMITIASIIIDDQIDRYHYRQNMERREQAENGAKKNRLRQLEQSAKDFLNFHNTGNYGKAAKLLHDLSYCEWHYRDGIEAMDAPGCCALDDDLATNVLVTAASMYLEGDGCRKDVNQAISCLKVASDKGNVFAQRRIAEICRMYISDNRFTESRLFENEIPSGMKTILDLYPWGARKTIRPSIGEWYRKAAENGDAEAQFQLAICYERGDFGVLQDHDKSLLWLRRAARQGHDGANNALINGITKICSMCCGKGKVPCEKCGGDPRCKKCGGEGRVEIQKEDSCPDCRYETGVKMGYRRCRNSGCGAGKRFNGPHFVCECNDTGEIKCTTCNGSGKTAKTVWRKCETCRGSKNVCTFCSDGEIICPTCRGKRTVVNEKKTL